MTDNLNAAIRASLSGHVPSGEAFPAYDAVTAVLDKCQQMRAESGDRGVGHFIAAEFEQTIARALGIPTI